MTEHHDHGNLKVTLHTYWMPISWLDWDDLIRPHMPQDVVDAVEAHRDPGHVIVVEQSLLGVRQIRCQSCDIQIWWVHAPTAERQRELAPPAVAPTPAAEPFEPTSQPWSGRTRTALIELARQMRRCSAELADQAEVDVLAAVITEARMRGINAGAWTLARVILNHGWSRSTGSAVMRDLLAAAERGRDEAAAERDQLREQIAALTAERDRLLATRSAQCPVDDHGQCGDTCCRECGALNIAWFTDNPTWNAVMPNDGVRCVRCFVLAAKAKGISTRGAWRVAPEFSLDSNYGHGHAAGRAAGRAEALAEVAAPEIAVEWNTQFLNGGGRPIVEPSMTHSDRASAEDGVRYFADRDSKLVRREVHTYPDGSYLTTPWVVIDGP